MEITQEKATFLPNPEGLWDSNSKLFIPRKQCVPECMWCNKMYSDIPLGKCVLEDHVCIAYLNPKVMQRNGGCALQSNKKIDEVAKKKINPIKWSKRKNR